MEKEEEEEEEEGRLGGLVRFVCCCKHITRGSVCVCDTCHTCNDALNLRHLLLMKSIDVIYLVAVAPVLVVVIVGGVLRCHAVVWLQITCTTWHQNLLRFGCVCG